MTPTRSCACIHRTVTALSRTHSCLTARTPGSTKVCRSCPSSWHSPMKWHPRMSQTSSRRSFEFAESEVPHGLRYFTCPLWLPAVQAPQYFHLGAGAPGVTSTPASTSFSCHPWNGLVPTYHAHFGCRCRVLKVADGQPDAGKLLPLWQLNPAYYLYEGCKCDEVRDGLGGEHALTKEWAGAQQVAAPAFFEVNMLAPSVNMLS